MMSHLINGHVTALIRHLCCHNNGLALIDAPLNRLTEMITLTHWQTAHTETLNNNGIITLKEIPQIVPVNPRNQLQQSDFRVHFVVKLRRCCFYLMDILNLTAILNHCKTWIINTCKSLKTLCPDFSGSCSQNNFSGKDNLNTAGII